MTTRYYIIENGEPVEAQHGDGPTHVLVPIEDWRRVCGDSVELHKAEHVAEIADAIYSLHPLTSFVEFWDRYPRRVAKKAALKIWMRMSDEQRRQAIAVIDDHTRMWIAEGRGTRTIPHATTWLNQERWEDEIGFVPERNVTPVNNRTTRSKSVLDEMEGRQ